MRPIALPATMPVAGVSFRQRELRDVVEGDRIRIVAVDDNPHDAEAVEVRLGEELLGFIPRALAGRLRSGPGREWQGVVSEVLRGETWGLRVVVHPMSADLGPDPRISDAPHPARHVADGSPRAGRDMSANVKVGPMRVRAISGRDLGVLLREEAGKVVVRSDNGTETAYPSGIVTIEGR